MINQQNSASSDIQIFVDGQNQEQIQEYVTLNNTNNWDPCIPMTFHNNFSITIGFDNDFIDNFADWYPLEICNYNNKTLNYRNEYLFDGGKSITINNLIIDNYFIADNNKSNYPFIRSIDYYNASVTCNNCSLINISSNAQYLFNTIGSIYLFNNLFMNVVTSQQIIYGQHDYFAADLAHRQITIEATSFSNITAYSVIETAPSTNDVK